MCGSGVDGGTQQKKLEGALAGGSARTVVELLGHGGGVP